MFRVMMDVLEEHLEEATFLWLQWERALLAPDFNMQETAEREERLLAHLDGLVVGGAPAIESLLNPALGSDEPARLSAAAFALLETGPAGVDMVLAALRGGSPERIASLQRALEVSDSIGLDERVLPLLKVEVPELQTAAVEVLASRGIAPRAILEPLFVHEVPQVRIAALKSAGYLLKGARGNLLVRSLESSHVGIRNAAMEVGLLAGSRAAWDACYRDLKARGEQGDVPRMLLALGGGEKEARLLVDLLDDAVLRPNLLWALGFSGQVVAAEACLEWMRDEGVAHLAAEAFCSITGLQLSEAFVAQFPAAREEPIPLRDDALDADLSSRPEDDLPRPEARVVADWWKKERRFFENGVRYLRGKPLDGQVFLDALEREPMRRRHVLARELAIRSHGACQLHTRVLTRRQRAELVTMAPTCKSLSMLPLSRGLH